MLHSDLLACNITQTHQISASVFRPISHIEASQLELALCSDAAALAQVAMVSLIEGVAGVAMSRYAWAKVKLYYSSFYSIRSMLMMDKFSIFYIGRSPLLLEARPSESAKKKSGNSHSVAFDVFRQVFRNDIVLSQQIDGICPLRWLDEKRSEISYRTAPYSDPESPPDFQLSRGKVRLHFQEYCLDNTYLYAFDSSHSMLAYPIMLIKRMSAFLQSRNSKVEIDINSHYRDILVSSNCFVPAIRKEFPIYNFN